MSDPRPGSWWLGGWTILIVLLIWFVEGHSSYETKPNHITLGWLNSWRTKVEVSASFSSTQAKHWGAPSRSHCLLAPTGVHPLFPQGSRLSWQHSLVLHVSSHEAERTLRQGCRVPPETPGPEPSTWQVWAPALLDGPSLWSQTGLHHPLPGPATLTQSGRGIRKEQPAS